MFYWCGVVSKGDADYKKIKKLAMAGEYDISCQCNGYGFIEAHNEDYSLILVRY